MTVSSCSGGDAGANGFTVATGGPSDADVPGCENADSDELCDDSSMIVLAPTTECDVCKW